APSRPSSTPSAWLRKPTCSPGRCCGRARSRAPPTRAKRRRLDPPAPHPELARAAVRPPFCRPPVGPQRAPASLGGPRVGVGHDPFSAAGRVLSLGVFGRLLLRLLAVRLLAPGLLL